MLLGERIKMLRKKYSITQSEIAERLNMGRSNFGHIENNRVTPSSDDLQIIADILKTSTDFLLGRTDDPAPIVQSETPPNIKAWLRAGNPDLSEEEKETLAEDLESYFQMRKQRILEKRKHDGRD